MVYSNNQGFQTALLSACQTGTLILTSGGRLARHLKHRYRESQVVAGKMGWAVIDILSLNAWIWKVWKMTWPSTRPLSRVNCFALWKEASSRVPPPKPFLADFKLFETLDQTYTALIRHGLPTKGAPTSDTTLLAWRQEVMQTFEALARGLKGFHPSLLPVYLAQAIREGHVPLPDAIVLAAFEAPAPIEETLFDSLATACELRRFDLPAGMPEKTARIVMPNRKQEVAWLTAQLLMDAQTTSLNRIGVVVPDAEAYVPHIKQAFREIMGESLDQTQSAYNISVGTPLLKRSLVQSGLLPLRFWVEGKPRTILLSLVLSTYYARWSKERDRVARADRVWRRHGVDAGLRLLLDMLSGEDPNLLSQLNGGHPTLEEALSTFVQEPIRTGAEWVGILKAFWDVVGFPVSADEADIGAWHHLRILLQRIREDLKRTLMSLPDFMGMLNHCLSEEMVHVRGSEEAGIQVLGIIESRGLSFEKLYVLGLAAGSLPRPVRPLPLLDTWERRQVQGATAESQFTFAQQAFLHLLACAPHVTLVRPEEESAEPLAPSPFWVQAEGEEIHQEIDLWNAPDSAWIRAAWLQQANKGLSKPAQFTPTDPPVEGHVLSKTVSVSDLAVAFTCLFRFYAETILKVFPLDELITGISPLDRGNFLHRALALFTRRCRDQGLVGKKNETAMENLLRACSNEALLSDVGRAVHAQRSGLCQHARVMERHRWMGDKDGAPGLLTEWLYLERMRLDDGWLWLCEEAPFDGLTDPDWPFSVSGRIDRIDYHKDRGFMLWDYKSGEHPTRQAVLEHFIDPQILAYMQAAKEHRIAELAKKFGANAPIAGGYITLKTPSAVRHKELTPKGGDWEQVLQKWKESVANLGKKMVLGQFEAKPHHLLNGARQEQEKVCQYCPYRPLCGNMEAMCS